MVFSDPINEKHPSLSALSHVHGNSFPDVGGEWSPAGGPVRSEGAQGGGWEKQDRAIYFVPSLVPHWDPFALGRSGTDVQDVWDSCLWIDCLLWDSKAPVSNWYNNLSFLSVSVMDKPIYPTLIGVGGIPDCREGERKDQIGLDLKTPSNPQVRAVMRRMNPSVGWDVFDEKA